MHLDLRLTTTSTKKRKEKITKAKQAELEQGWRDRNQRLKDMHLPKETFDQYMEWVYGRGKKEKAKKTGEDRTKAKATIIRQGSRACQEETQLDSTSPGTNNATAASWLRSDCPLKPSPTYSGTEMIGVSQMHKSNMVPVFSDEEIKDISKMRR